MKREIRRGDISEYSSEAPRDDIDTSRDEEVEYRGEKLQRSSGNTTFHLVNDTDGNSDPDMDSWSLSQTFSASGSYNMQLKSCHKINKFTYDTRKKKILADIQSSSKEEGLKANIDKSKFIYQYNFVCSTIPQKRKVLKK